jgi:hypothetical protein
MQVLVMFSRVILGMHSFNQVLMGFMIGAYSLVPYYFFMEGLLTKYMLRLINSEQKVFHIVAIMCTVLASFLIEALLTYIPNYSNANYLAVIQDTAGC